MLKKAFLAIVVLFVVATVVFCIVVSMQPADFKISRSATMAATPEKVFAQVNDFHNWDAWSPWAKIDPTMKAEFSGAAAGVGAVYSWAGTGDAGEGEMTIAASHPSEHIGIDIEFLKPMAAKNTIDFMFKPEGDKTNVMWTMAGKNNFAAKAFCMFVNMDKLVGGDFEKGLAQMKMVVESGPKPAPVASPDPAANAK
ncbi:SRPBCC family protein [soil metagenome]